MIKKLPRNWCIRQNTHQNVCNWFNRKYDIQSFLKGGYNYLSNRPVKDCNLVFQENIYRQIKRLASGLLIRG